MDPQRLVPFKLETFSSFKTICLFVLYLILVGLALLVGLFGPTPWKDSLVNVPANSQDWTRLMRGYGPQVHEFGPLDKLNQYFVYSMQFQHSGDLQVSVTADMITTVSIYGKEKEEDPWGNVVISNSTKTREVECSKGASKCTQLNIAFEPFLPWNYYQVSTTLGSRTYDRLSANVGFIDFRARWVDKTFTTFMIAFRYAFCVFSFLSIAYTYSKLYKYRHDRQTEQNWVLALLIATIGFNNPLFACNFFVDGWFFPTFDIMLIVTFVCVLLLFWLVMVHMIYTFPRQRTLLRFYAPKIFLVLLIYAFVVAILIFERFHDLDDPTTNGSIANVEAYAAVKVIGIILAILYLFYLLYGVFRAVGESAARNEAALETALERMGQPDESGEESRRKVKVGMRKRFKSLFGLSIVVVVIVIAGIIFSAFNLENGDGSAAVFLVFWTVLNLYVYMLAYFFLPTKRKTHSDYGQVPGMLPQAPAVTAETEAAAQAQSTSPAAVASASASSNERTERTGLVAQAQEEDDDEEEAGEGLDHSEVGVTYVDEGRNAGKREDHRASSAKDSGKQPRKNEYEESDNEEQV
jgi:hypothetical protein